MRLLYALGLAYLGLCSWYLAWRYFSSLSESPAPIARPSPPIDPTPSPANPTARDWFYSIKPRCNAVEVETAMRSSPPPTTTDGSAYAASCFALAGKIDRARGILEQIPEDEQYRAAGVVFAIGHPVADAGDDESAGPIMQLVLEYQPENYMALYHAGMSEYILGELPRSERHLREFLDIYQNDDGWRRNALTVLERIENGG